MRYFVLDTETTGLNPEQHRIIEVALIELDPTTKEPIGHWSSLVRPEDGVVDPEALRVNGISPEEIQAAPPEKDVVDYLASQLLPDALIVAHHAPFDLSFLAHTFSRHEYPSWQGDFICTRTAFGILVPGKPRSLHNVAEYFGISIIDRHRALGDAKVTAEVFRILAGLADEKGIDLRNLLLYDPNRPLAWVPPKARWWEAAAS